MVCFALCMFSLNSLPKFLGLLMSYFGFLCSISAVDDGDASEWVEKGLYIRVNRSDRIEGRGVNQLDFTYDISQCRQ